VRLGTAYLGNRSDAAVDRGERSGWLRLALLTVLGVKAALAANASHGGHYLLVPVAAVAVVLALGMRNTRRVHHNLAALRGAPPPAMLFCV
jgi:hypothetical protein